jgi:hypothetical protein
LCFFRTHLADDNLSQNTKTYTIPIMKFISFLISNIHTNAVRAIVAYFDFFSVIYLDCKYRYVPIDFFAYFTKNISFLNKYMIFKMFMEISMNLRTCYFKQFRSTRKYKFIFIQHVLSCSYNTNFPLQHRVTCHFIELSIFYLYFTAFYLILDQKYSMNIDRKLIKTLYKSMRSLNFTHAHIGTFIKMSHSM